MKACHNGGMPKPLKKTVKPKRPSDPNQWAHQLVRESTEREPTEAPTDFTTHLSAYMSKLGRKGGKVSGARRMKNLSEEQRSTIALKAATARWKKVKQKKG